MKNFLIFIITFAFLFSGCFYDCKSFLNEDIKPVPIDGIVVGKDKSDIGCFGTIVWQQQSKLDTLKEVCYCVLQAEDLWKYIQAGDSLHKSKNSLAVQVYRKDTIQTFNFPCCSR